MTIYRLEPILLDHPSWRTSSYREGPLWVEADSEQEARQKVTYATDMGVASGGSRIRSPWDLAEVTNCVADNSRHIELGGVMMESGDYLSVELDLDPDDEEDY